LEGWGWVGLFGSPPPEGRGWVKILHSILYVLSLFSFTFFSKPKESNKEKAPETISLAFRYARYTGLIGATLQSKLRAVSGSPPHLVYSVIRTLPFSFFEDSSTTIFLERRKELSLN
jgi:hypothetical protein